MLILSKTSSDRIYMINRILFLGIHSIIYNVAEGEGFEPPMQLPARLISSQVPSTNSATLPSIKASKIDNTSPAQYLQTFQCFH